MTKTQLPLFTPESKWTPPDLASLPSWSGMKRISLDTETYDPHLRTTGPSVRTGGHLVGVSVGFEDGRGFYLPFGHKEGDNLPKENVMRYVKDNFKTYDGEVVGANLAYDLDWLWEDGVEMPMVKRFRDVLIAEPLIDDNKFTYNLDSVSKTWVGEGKSKDLLMQAARDYGWDGKKRTLGEYIHLLPARYVGMYGEDDANLPLKVLAQQEKEIERQGIQRVWDLESDVLPVLVRMRRRGVRVDLDHLQDVDIRCATEMREASDLITRQSGVAVGTGDAMKKDLIIQALNAVGHQVEKDDSIDKVFIATREKDCEVVAALGRLRKWDTLRKLSIEPTKQHLHGGDRIHCSYNQLANTKDGEDEVKGVRGGRLSCEHTNMQQQPARDEDIGPIWRRTYIPEIGQKWASLDYSQQEPRMLVHFAEIVANQNWREWPMRGAVEAATRYRDDPETDNHQMMAELAGIERKPAKALFLGICYGMGDKKLCADLGLPTKVITLERGPNKGQRREVAGPEAEKIMRKLHRALPFLKEMEQLAKEQATSNGYISTVLGRRCRFPRDDDGLNYKWTRKALNRLIQGSSADQTKAAMVEADREGYELQLQVHDEVDFSVEDRSVAEGCAEIMRHCVELRVPSKVDVEIGPSWGEAK